MQVSAKRVTQAVITISLDEEEARGVVEALAYYNLAEGGNNFEMGYRGEDADPSVLRGRRAARALTKVLDKKLEALSRKSA